MVHGKPDAQALKLNLQHSVGEIRKEDRSHMSYKIQYLEKGTYQNQASMLVSVVTCATLILPLVCLTKFRHALNRFCSSSQI